MPNLRNIQEFAGELKRLGNEPEVLRKRGETVEEPSAAPPLEPSPGAQSPEEQSPGEPLGDQPEVGPATGEAAEVFGGELGEELPPDIDQLLAGLGEEQGEEPSEAESEEPEGEPGEDTGVEEESFETTPEVPIPEATEEVPTEGEDTFFDDFLRESAAAEESEMTSISEVPEGEPPTGEGLPQAAGDDESLFFEIPSAEDLAPPEEGGGTGEEAPPFEFDETEGPAMAGQPEEAPGLPEGLEGAEEPSTEEFGELPGEDAFGELPAEIEEAAGGGGAEELELSGDLGLPEEEPPSFEPGAAEPTEHPPGEQLAESEELPGEFELPSFDEEIFGEEEPAAPAGEGTPQEAPGLEEAFGGIEGPEFEAGIEPETPPVPEEEPIPEDLGLPEPEPGTGEEPPEESMFEESAFEMEEEGAVEPSAAPEGEASPEEGAPPTGAAGAAAGGLGDLDDFGLGDISEQFGLTGEESQTEEDLNPALAVGEAAPPPGVPTPGAPPSVGGPTDLRISDRDFEHIQRTLSALPRNLRIVIEELIGEQDLGGPQLSELVDLLVRGAPPREIADATSRIIGRTIEIPAAYEKKTGLEFEEERATFAYRFRHNILPILRVFLAGAAIIALLVFLGYRFVYRPIHAYTLYAAGYNQLQNDNFVTANDDFATASREWQMKNWYYRYAEGYVQRKQYSFAAQKYDSLLKVWPADRKGIFDYSDMESKILGNYTKANQLLGVILDKNMWDYQGLLRAGDNYLRWGEEDPSKYELARKDYAMLLQHYGTSNQVLFRMLRYFIKTDNLKQVEILKTQFQADPRITVDPVAYAELGGYLIDKNRLSDVHDILFRALKVEPTLPETNYNLARYFNKIGDYSQEAVALQKTLNDLQNATPLTRRRLGMLVDTYDRIGENLYQNKRYLDAEQAYNKGINRYETALKQSQLKPSAEFGKLYANLGDLNYYVSGNFDEALQLYLKAETNGYQTPELRYKEGYVYYRDQDYKSALLKFMNAAGNYSDNRDLLYATANTFFKRNDYSAAEGYYLNLLNSLEAERRSITTFEPNVIPAHHDLLVNLMKVYNNLGVTLYELSRRSSDATKYSQSLVNLTRSMEAFDQLTRNPVTKEKTNAINLAFINTKDILYPTPSYQVQIYSDLPQDLGVKSF